MTDDSNPDVATLLAKGRSIAQRMASQQVGLRAAKAGDIAADAAETIRDIGVELKKKRESPATQSLVDSLARAADGMATYLHAADGDRILTDVQAYGRAQPAVAAALAALGGFAAARILKVSTIAGGRSATS